MRNEADSGSTTHSCIRRTIPLRPNCCCASRSEQTYGHADSIPLRQDCRTQITLLYGCAWPKQMLLVSLVVKATHFHLVKKRIRFCFFSSLGRCHFWQVPTPQPQSSKITSGRRLNEN
jgi:hypothetical protein